VPNEADPQERFRKLFLLQYRNVLAYALRRTSNLADAQDVLADTFTVAWRRITDAPEGDAARAWLYGIAYRTVANHRRSARRLQALRERLHSQPQIVPEPNDLVSQHENLSAVLAALGRLPAAEQEVLRLAAWENLSHQEIGAVLGCSENAAAVRLHRARRRLAQQMKEGGLFGHFRDEGQEAPRARQIEEGR
jgi:RNA polymerase sigma factor (sigma-70 family)